MDGVHYTFLRRVSVAFTCRYQQPDFGVGGNLTWNYSKDILSPLRLSPVPSKERAPDTCGLVANQISTAPDVTRVTAKAITEGFSCHIEPPVKPGGGCRLTIDFEDRASYPPQKAQVLVALRAHSLRNGVSPPITQWCRYEATPLIQVSPSIDEHLGVVSPGQSVARRFTFLGLEEKDFRFGGTRLGARDTRSSVVTRCRCVALFRKAFRTVLD